MNSDRFDAETRIFGRVWSRRVVAGGAVGAVTAALSRLDAQAKPKKKRKKEICHCASNDPATCQTIKVTKKARKQHLRHLCDYTGPCQPGVVGQCAQPIVGCTQNSECPGDSPFCVDRICVQCRNEDDCQGANAGACENGICDAAFLTCSDDGAAIQFTDGPGNPPVSRGSVQMTVPEPPDSNSAFATIRTEDYNGVAVEDLTSLTYSRFVEPDSEGDCPGDIPYIVLRLTGGNFLITVPGGPFICNRWVTRDALDDKWWSPTLDGGAFAPVQAPRPLSDFLAEFSTSELTIQNATTGPEACPGVVGGLRLSAGEWGASDQVGDYVAYISHLIVGVEGENQTYRF